MTTYEIYIKNQPNGTKTFEHIKNTTSRPERNQIIREYTTSGKTIVVIERYSCGTTCRCEYAAR